MSVRTLKILFEDINESVRMIDNRMENIYSAEFFTIDDAGLEKLDSISLRLQIIGETIKRINKENPEILKAYSKVEWKK